VVLLVGRIALTAWQASAKDNVLHLARQLEQLLGGHHRREFIESERPGHTTMIAQS